MKATWWHILEPFEPIRVMYVSAAGGGVFGDTLGWRRAPSFFRVIRKTSHAMTSGGGKSVQPLAHCDTAAEVQTDPQMASTV